MNKKAAIELSVRFIILIILALVILILLLALIRYFFGESTIKLDEQVAKYVLPPTAIISSPMPDDIYTVFDNVTFDGSKSYDKHYEIAGYFWDFDGNSLIDSRKAIDHSYYWEPGEYNLTLKVVNEMGAIGIASQIVRVVTRNKKKDSLIKDSLFLVRDNERTNEETILRLIPVVTWWDADGFHRLPYYVYYVNESDKTIDEGKIQKLMNRYEKAHAYVFDDANIPCPIQIDCDPPMPPSITCCRLSDGKNITKVNNAIDDIYFAFWDLYEYVVLVNKTDTESFLIASLFAAFYNSPIIYIDNGNLGKYQNSIINNQNTKRAYCIPSFISLDESVRNFITSNNIDYYSYSPTELRTGKVNRIVKLSSNVTMERS